jgi:hypothetical protein
MMNVDGQLPQGRFALLNELVSMCHKVTLVVKKERAYTLMCASMTPKQQNRARRVIVLDALENHLGLFVAKRLSMLGELQRTVWNNQQEFEDEISLRGVALSDLKTHPELNHPRFIRSLESLSKKEWAARTRDLVWKPIIEEPEA